MPLDSAGASGVPMPKPTTTVVLHGRLAKIYGRRHELGVRSASEAAYALCALHPGFRQDFESGYYRVIRGTVAKGMPLSEAMLTMRIGIAGEIHFIPKAVGSKNGGGIGKAILGAVIIIAAVALSIPSGGSSIALGATAFAGISYGSIAFFGASLLLAGISAVISPQPKNNSTTTDPKVSFGLSGITNSTTQGTPIPAVYGRTRVGSVVASFGYEAVDFSGTVTTTPATGSATSGTSPAVTIDDVSVNGGALGAGGGGKGGGGGAMEAPNTLRSDAIVRVIDILSEGPIGGLVDGAKSIFFNNTPLMAADGTYNFQGVSWDVRLGYPEQDPVAGYPAAEETIQVGVQVKQEVPVIRTITSATANAARVTIHIPALAQQNTTNGDLLAGPDLDYIFEVQPEGGAWTTCVLEHIAGQKTTSSYQRSYRFDLPNFGTSTVWNVRMTRQTPDSQTANVQNDTWWDAYTVITDHQLIYPNTAYIALTIDAAAFGSQIPTRAYEIDGILCQVPLNYDPVGHTYATTGPGTSMGTWDGASFQVAATSNPAWCLYDLLSNGRYGIGLPASAVAYTVYDLFTISQYCDGMVPTGYQDQDGNITTELRYALNVSMNTQDDAFKVLQSMVSTFRGMIYWGAGRVCVTADMPTVPSSVLNQANVLDGDFNYEGTSLKSRHTVARVAWQDPTNSYQTTIEVVEDFDQVVTLGQVATDIVAFGCTSRGLAHRAGKWLLDTEKTQTDTLTCKTGMEHLRVRPGDITIVADPHYAGVRMGGRCPGGSTTTRVKLDSVFPTTGDLEYLLTIAMPDGTLVSNAIVVGIGLDDTFNGPNNICTMQVALPLAPAANATWILSSTGTDVPHGPDSIYPVSGRQFQVLALAEPSRGTFSIAAVNFDPNKFARIEYGLQFDPTPYSDLGLLLGAPLPPPTNVSARDYVNGVGTTTLVRATVSWTAVADARVTSYEVRAVGPEQTTTSATGSSANFDGLQLGTYVFGVRASGRDGRASVWVDSESVLVDGVADPPDPITGLTAIGGALQVSLSWGGSDARDLLHYEVWRSPATQNGTHPFPITAFTPTGTPESNGATLVVAVAATSYTDIGVELGPDEAWAYWVRPINTTLVQGAFTGPVKALTTFYLTNNLEQAIQNTAPIAQALLGSAPIAVQTLPATGLEGQLAFQNSDQKLYKWSSAANGGAGGWVLFIPIIPDDNGMIPASIVTGIQSAVIGSSLTEDQINQILAAVGTQSITSDQIVSVAGSKVTGQITNATLTAGRIYDVDPTTGNLIQGINTSQLLGTLAATKIVDVNPVTGLTQPGVSAAKLLGTIDVSAIPPVPTSKLTGDILASSSATLSLSSAQISGKLQAASIAGQLAATQIATITAPQITGALSDAQIAAISASKLVGLLQSTQISSVSAPQITGALTDTQIAALSAAKLTGLISASQIMSVAAPQITGALTDAQLQSISAAKLTGAVQANQIASVTAPQITGELTDAQIAQLSSAKLTGLISASQIASVTAPQITGALTDTQLQSISAAKLTGAVQANQIASVTAPQITGELTDAQISALSAAKLTGQLAATQIANITAPQITGALTDTQLQSISAAKLIGAVQASQIDTVTAVQITGSLTDAQIEALSAAKLTGQITNTQVGPNAISTGNIAAGSIVTASLAASAVTAEKLSVGSGANLVWNSCLPVSADGWIVGRYSCFPNPTIGAAGGQFALSGFGSGEMSYGPQMPANDYIDASWAPNTPNGVPCLPGQVWEGQAQVISFGCTAAIFLLWFDRNGNTSSVKVADNGTTTNGPSDRGIGGATLDCYTKLTVIGTAPADAAFVTVMIRAQQSVAAGQFITFTQVMLAQTVPNATQVSTWSAGGNTILAGGMIETNSITARAIAANTITAGQIAANTITAGQIAAGTITGTNIAGQTITGANIVAGSITTGQIAAGTITGNDIAGQTITGNEIAAGTITAANLAANTITAGQIAAGTITAAQLAAASVTTAQLAAGSITAAQLAVGSPNNSIANSCFAVSMDGWVGVPGTPTIGSNPDFSLGGLGSAFFVTSAMPPGGIADAWYTNGQSGTGRAYDASVPCYPGEVWEAQIAYIPAFGTVQLFLIYADTTGGESGSYASDALYLAPEPDGKTLGRWTTIVARGVAPSSAVAVSLLVRFGNNSQATASPGGWVTRALLGRTVANATAPLDWTPGGVVSISGGMIQAQAVTARAIAAGTITSTQIAANTITAGQIAAGTITGTNIAGQTITGANIVAGTITTGQIAAGTITGDKIAGGTITAGLLAAGTITGDKIAGNTITGANIVAGTITTAQLAAAAITTAQLAAGSITAAQLAIGSPNNSIANSCFAVSMDGWVGVPGTPTLATDPYNLSGQGSAFFATAALPPGTYQDAWYTNGQNTGLAFGAPVACSPGDVWEAQIAYIPSFGTVELFLIYSDASGNETASPSSGSDYLPGQSNGKTLDRWTTIVARGTAPANTVATTMLIRFGNNTQTTNAAGGWVTRTLLGRTVANATAPLDWTPGGVVSISGGMIQAQAVTARAIAAGTITSTQIAANTITAGNIAAGTITANQVAAGTITGTTIAAQTVTGANIVAGTITAGLIAAGTIQGNNIAGQTITGNNVAAGTITAVNLAANTITAGQIAAGTITAAQLAAASVTTAQLAAGSITAAQLAIGSPNNSIANSCFAVSMDGWVGVEGTPTIGSNPNFSLGGLGSAFFVTAPLPPGGTSDAWFDNGQSGSGRFYDAPTPCSPGDVWEAQIAYINAGGSIQLFLVFADATGGETASYDSGVIGLLGRADGKTLDQWTTIVARGAAPANTVAATLIIRFGNNGTAPSSAGGWVTRTLLGRTVANATAPLDWTPGGVVSISGGMIQAQAVTARAIAAGTITSTQIAANTITAGQIAAGTITGTNIAGQTITGANIVAGSITTGQIAAGTITGNDIAGGTITGNNVAAGTITAANLAANTITAGQIAAGTITAAQLAAASVTTAQLAAGSITAAQLAIGSPNNSIANSCFAVSMDGWVGVPGTPTIGSNPNFSLGGLGSAFFVTAPLQPGGISDAFYTDGQSGTGRAFDASVPCTPGDVWEAQIAYIPAFGSVQLFLIFANATGGETSFDSGVLYLGPESDGKTLDRWTTIVARGTAPAGTVAVGLLIRFGNNSQATASPGGWVTRTLLGRTVPNATAPLDWTPGGVVSINGGIIQSEAIVARHIVAGQIETTALAAGAVTAEKLSIGSSTNVISNPSCVISTDGWINASFAGTTIGEGFPGFTVAGEGTGYLNYPGQMAVGQPLVVCWAPSGSGSPAVPGLWYECQARIAAHRCAASVQLQFLRSDGSLAGQDGSAPGAVSGARVVANGGTDLNQFGFSWAKGIAPNDTTAYRIVIYGTNDGQTDYAEINAGLSPGQDCFLWWCQASLGTSTPVPMAQSQPQPYAPGGVTEITGGVIKADTIVGAHLVAGSITAEKLSIGSGSNLVWNSCLPVSADGWIVGRYSCFPNPTIGAASGQFALSGFGSGEMSYGPQMPANDYIDASWAPNTPNGVPCLPGQVWEGQAQVISFGCTAAIFLLWFDRNGNNSSVKVADNGTTTNGPSDRGIGGATLDCYTKLTVIGTAPSDAAFVTIMIRAQQSVAAGQFITFTQVMLAQTVPNATQVSTWSAGGNTILAGGMIETNSITARAIAANSITTHLLAVGNSDNLITNSCLAVSTDGWTASAANATYSNFNTCASAYTQYATTDGCGVVETQIQPNGFVDIHYQQVSISGGSTLEGQAMLLPQQSLGSLYLEYFDANRNHLSFSTSFSNTVPVVSGGVSGVGTLAPFALAALIDVAPASAAFCSLVLRFSSPQPSLADGVAIFTRCGLGVTVAGATQVSTWSAGGITSIGAGMIETNAVVARTIASGAVTADKLTIASASNVIGNPTCQVSSWGWVLVSSAPNAVLGSVLNDNIAPTSFALAGEGTGVMRADTEAPGQIIVACWDPDDTNGVACTAGDWWEGQAYLGAHRCAAYVHLTFWDAGNNELANVQGNRVAGPSAGTTLNQYGFSWVKGQAPAGSVRVKLEIWGIDDNGSDIGSGIPGQTPYVFFTRCVLGESTSLPIAAGAQPQPYQIGGVTQIVGGSIQTDTITARMIGAGQITAAKLAVGSSTNVIYNSCGFPNAVGWSAQYGLALGVQAPTDNWGLIGYGSAYVSLGNLPNGTAYDVTWSPGPVVPGTPFGASVPANPGDLWEAQVRVMTHRCSAQLYVVFTGGGNETGANQTAPISVQPPSDGHTIGQYQLLSIRCTAPAGTTAVTLLIRMANDSAAQAAFGGTAGTNPYIFFTQAGLGSVIAPNAAQPLPWGPGGITSINGGVIQAGTILAEQLAVDSVTAVQIASGAIVSDKIAAGAVTAASLAVGSPSNLVWNGCPDQGSDGWNRYTFGPYMPAATDGTQIQMDAAAVLERYSFELAGLGSAFTQYIGPANNQIYSSQGFIWDWSPTSGVIGFPAGGASRTYGAAASIVAGNGCIVKVQILFLDGAGNTVPGGTFTSPPVSNNVGPNEGAYEDCYQRVSVVGVAPGGTGYVLLRIFGTGTDSGCSQPYFAFTKAQLGVLATGTTAVGDWQPGGVTSISGGMIQTGTLNADRINVGTLAAATAFISTLTAETVNATTIKASLVGTNKLTADEIDVDHLIVGGVQAGAIGSDQIAAHAIVANLLAADELITLSAQIGVGVITAVQIADATIQNANIADLTVAGEKIQPNAISNVAFTRSVGTQSGGQKLLQFAVTVPDGNTAVQLLARVYLVGNLSVYAGDDTQASGGGEGNGGY